MGSDVEKAKLRIKKLLALSSSPNGNEAAAAIEKANEIMREHGLSESQCRYERRSVPATKRPSSWRDGIAKSVARLNCCEVFRNSDEGKIYFFGDGFDAFMAGEMYRYLTKTVERMTKTNVRKSAGRQYRENYKTGIAYGLHLKIRDMGASASWGPERDRKTLAVRTALEKDTALASQKYKPSDPKSAGFRRGMAAGEGVSLNRQATGHGGRYLGSPLCRP